MEGFRKLGAAELLSFARIEAGAYPGFHIASEEDLQKLSERMQKRGDLTPRVDYYGLFRGGELAGGLNLYSYEMNMLGTRVGAGGIGNLAVDLLRKKEHVARDMVLATLRLLREQDTPVSVLYPFRPDFYRKMGFGYGAKMSRYQLKPADLPKGPSREHVEYLTRDDAGGMLACYTRFFERTHGAMAKSIDDMNRAFESMAIKVVGCKRGGQVTAYTIFTFRPDKEGRFLLNDIVIRDTVYDTPADLLELMTFLHAQADQVRKVIVDTQDDFFHFLPFDPRDGSDDLIPSVYHVTNSQGVGLMYRVLDVKRVFQALAPHDFGCGTCRLRINVEDSFLPENDGSVIVHFDAGRPSVKGDRDEWDVAIRLNIAEFSSLLMGAVDFASLYRYGLAEVSGAKYVDVVDRLFRAPRPVCLTAF